MSLTFKITMPQKQLLQKKLQPVQKYVDSKILQKCDPYIPFKTGMLRDSGILGTKIGSGRIRWIAPYARKQYYKGLSTGKRGRYWVKRAMTAHGESILRGAQEKLGGG